jgi:hypothetical protein
MIMKDGSMKAILLIDTLYRKTEGIAACLAREMGLPYYEI